MKFRFTRDIPSILGGIWMSLMVVLNLVFGYIAWPYVGNILEFFAGFTLIFGLIAMIFFLEIAS